MMTPETACPAGQWGENFPCQPIPNGLLDQNQKLPVWTSRNGWTTEFNVPGETHAAPDTGAQFPILLHGSADAQVYEMSRENAGQMIPNRVAVNNGAGLVDRVVADVAEPIVAPSDESTIEGFCGGCPMMMGGMCPRMGMGGCGCGMHRMIVLFIVVYLFVMMGFRMRFPKEFAKMRLGFLGGFALLLAYYYWMHVMRVPGIDFAGKFLWAILFVLFFLLVSA